MTTRRTVVALLAGATVLGAVTGCADVATPGATSGVTPAAATQGTHTMPDGSAMSGHAMSDHAMSDHAMSDGERHAGHGGDGLALWATQKTGGTVMVVDGDGRPFYRSDGPTCAGPCTAEWEPVSVDDGRAPELLGVQRSDVGAVRREDGVTQLTLGGAPLYRHAGDVVEQPDPRRYSSRGWFVVTPRGERVTG